MAQCSTNCPQIKWGGTSRNRPFALRISATVKPSIPIAKQKQRGCEFSQQDQNGHWYCELLAFSGQPFAIVTPRLHIKWATTSAHKLLQRYWPARTGMENRLPAQIVRWMNMRRKRAGAKGNAPTIVAPLIINRPSARITVRSMRDGTFSILVFEELLLELSAERLVPYGLTPRETEVLRWLVKGKSSFEIATILNISVRTVSKHLGAAYLRLGVENCHAAVAMVHDELMRIAPGR